MGLTNSQLLTLKAAIVADANINTQPMDADGHAFIAAYLNALTNPAFIVWQQAMTSTLSRAAVVQGATQLDNLTAGKRDALLYILASTLDCRDANVRQAIDDLTGSQNTLKNALIAAEKRTATRGEKIFATGTGTTASPATAVDGTSSISVQDVTTARENF